MTVDMVVSAEEDVKKYPLPMDWHAPVDTVLKSFFEIIEPWKVQTSTYERGVPHVHDKLGKFNIYLNHNMFLFQ